jgi:single-strand DNA-binding protein
MFQQITLVGNLGADPIMRYTDGGMAVTNLNVATSETWTDRSTGERKERTVWFKVACWDKTAENAANYLRKGNKVLIIGRMQNPEVWTDKNGMTQANLKVTADTLKFLTPRSAGEERAYVAAPNATDLTDEPTPAFEDIPF